jgi:hypothetical protein
MTSVQLLNQLRLLVGDKNKIIWSSDTDLYAVLSQAQRDFVLRVLGAPNIEDNYDILADLIVTVVKFVDNSGLDLSTIDMVRGGLVSIKSVLRGSDRYYTRFPASKVGLMNNEFFRGNDYTPKYFINGNTLYALVSVGSYPVQVDITYIKTPVDITASVNPTVSPSFHDTVCVIAEALLRRTNDDFEKAVALENLTDKFIANVVKSGIKEPSTNTIGQYMRKREEGKA